MNLLAHVLTSRNGGGGVIGVKFYCPSGKQDLKGTVQPKVESL